MRWQAAMSRRPLNLFQDDCYWRDLVAFTWNIKTVEGKDQVRDMLTSQLGAIGPSNWTLAEGEVPTEEGGVITAWIQFETKLARCFGLIRLKDDKIWTLLTTMVELKGHEEPKAFSGPLARNTVPASIAPPGRRNARRRTRSWATPDSPIA